MQNLIIEGTKKSPRIDFDNSKNTLSIHGRSIMNNLDDDFYNPVFDLLSELKSSNASNFTLEFKLDYFNTSSHLSIIKILKGINELKNNVQVIWAYSSDDEEMKEIGEEIQKFCDVPFSYKAIVD